MRMLPEGGRHHWPMEAEGILAPAFQGERTKDCGETGMACAEIGAGLKPLTIYYTFFIYTGFCPVTCRWRDGRKVSTERGHYGGWYRVKFYEHAFKCNVHRDDLTSFIILALLSIEKARGGEVTKTADLDPVFLFYSHPSNRWEPLLGFEV